MKKRALSIILSLAMLLSLCAMFAGCQDDGPVNSGDAVNITFWHPITGPDSKYMQDLIRDFNKEYEGKIYVNASAQAEAGHYDKITNSFTDKSTADVCLVHKSRVPQYVANGMLWDMTALLAANDIKSSDYVGDSWTSCEFDGKMYAMAYDVLPTVLFYNRELIPEGYTEEDILSDDFTVEKMIEMALAAYDNSNPRQVTYGISFNFSFTESMFLSFLSQMDINPVSESNPYEALFACAEGETAAKAIMDMPLTKNADGISISSESGKDHLDIFCQGRALFTLDGIWSAPSACTKVPGRLDAGVALLPKVNDSATRTVSSDGHVFAMFNTANGGQADTAKQEAVGTFIKYMIDHSAKWCEGGKVAARADVAQNAEYMSLEWGYLSTKLDNIVSPVKVNTYKAITSEIGKYVADLCEGRTTDIKQALEAAASEGETLAKELNTGN